MAKLPRRPVVLLDAAVRRAPDFLTWSHVDKVRFFCWHLQSNCGVAAVGPVDVARCYEELKLESPSSISPFFDLLQRRQPSEMSKDEDGCRLESRVLEEFGVAYGGESTSHNDDLMKLAEKVSDARRRKYIDEALVCFRSGAYRAAVFMAWNLAREVLRERLAMQSNVIAEAIAGRSQPSGTRATDHDSEELTDRQLLDACERVAVISHADRVRLARRLDERDDAGKLSATAITPMIADGLIRSALEDVILRIW